MQLHICHWLALLCCVCSTSPKSTEKKEKPPRVLQTAAVGPVTRRRAAAVTLKSKKKKNGNFSGPYETLWRVGLERATGDLCLYRVESVYPGCSTVVSSWLASQSVLKATPHTGIQAHSNAKKCECSEGVGRVTVWPERFYPRNDAAPLHSSPIKINPG